MPDRNTQMQRLVEYLVGYNATRYIALGVEIGLFAALDRPGEGTTSAELAAAQGWDATYTEHLLRAGYALELLDCTDDRYRLAEHMAPALARPESPGYLASMAAFEHVCGRDFERMPALLRSGATYPYQDHDAEFIAGVAVVTHGIAAFVAGAVIPKLPGLAGRDDLRILDLGCGSGGAMEAIARALPRARITGVDVEPRSVDAANARLARAGLSDRAQARLAAAETVDDEARHDLVTLIQVLHETRPAVRETILQRAFAALRPGGVLLVVDEPYPDRLEDLRGAKNTAITQALEIFWGNPFVPLGEQRALLEGAGFAIHSQAVPPPGLISVTVAGRPG